MKKHIEAFDYAAQILKGVKHGALITAKADGRVNPMTIGWGSLGTEWNTPVFIAYVRESRFTRELLDKNPEFTVNIPLEGCDKKILQLCGTQSGRDVDKVAALNLTLEGAVRCAQSRGLPLLVSVERGLTFGRCSGSVLLDSGERLQIEGMNAMLCDIQAVW